MKVTKRNKDFFYALNALIKNVESADKCFFANIYNSKEYKLDKNLMSVYYMKSLSIENMSTILKSFLMLSKKKRKDFVSSVFWKRKVFSKQSAFVEVSEMLEIELGDYKRLNFCKKNIEDLFLIILNIKSTFNIIEENDYHFCKYIINNASGGLLSLFSVNYAISKGIDMNMENIFKTNNYRVINKAFLSLDISTRRKEIGKYKGKNQRIKNRLRLLSKQYTSEDFKNLFMESIYSKYKFRVLSIYTSRNYFDYIDDKAKLDLIFDLRDICLDLGQNNDVRNRAETIIFNLFKSLKRDGKILCIGTMKKLNVADSFCFKFLSISLFNDTSIL
ncbi:hypothetical protein N9W84_00830 [bacterium]|nr:hypothetical protein [bacterium]